MGPPPLSAVYSLLLSFILTVGIIGACVIGLLETHAYSTYIVPNPVQLSLLSIICPILSIMGNISPVVSVIVMISNSDVSNFPIQVVIAQATQNTASLAYGSAVGNSSFMLAAISGLVCQVVWLSAWYTILRRKYTIKLIHPIISAFFAVIVITTIAKALTLLDTDTIGTLSCVLTIVLCLSPLLNLGRVIRTKNVASLPVPMTMVMLITNMAWALYGALLRDNYVFFPSLFGFIITVFQLIITAWCWDKLFYDLSFLLWVFPPPEDVSESSELSPHNSMAIRNSAVLTTSSGRSSELNSRHPTFALDEVPVEQ